MSRVLSGHAGADRDEMLDSTTLRFTGRVYFYCESGIAREQRLEITSAAADLGLFPLFRSQALRTAENVVAETRRVHLPRFTQ